MRKHLGTSTITFFCQIIDVDDLCVADERRGVLAGTGQRQCFVDPPPSCNGA